MRRTGSTVDICLGLLLQLSVLLEAWPAVKNDETWSHLANECDTAARLLIGMAAAEWICALCEPCLLWEWWVLIPKKYSVSDIGCGHIQILPAVLESDCCYHCLCCCRSCPVLWIDMKAFLSAAFFLSLLVRSLLPQLAGWRPSMEKPWKIITKDYLILASMMSDIVSSWRTQ